MIRDIVELTKNAKLVCLADFLWNIGRTLPHAILTVFLIANGCSLVDIALLQTVFMITAMLTEFPSGVISDMTSRKIVYLFSLIALFASYFIIAFNKDIFILIIAYILYGLSVSLKSGTLDAEIVLEYRKKNKNIKNYSVIMSYVMNISAIIGGLSGSFLYAYIDRFIYFVSLVLFVFSFIIALLCKFDKEKPKKINHKTFIYEVKAGFKCIKSSKSLFYCLCLSAVTALFLQPFFQYWQVLYTAKGANQEFFGFVYVAFLLCGIIGSALYKKLNFKHKALIYILAAVPFVFLCGFIFEGGVMFTFPISVLLFFIFNQHLDIIKRKIAPAKTMSSFFSLSGTVEQISSSVSLFLMAFCVGQIEIDISYLILFSVFAILAVVVFNFMVKSIRLEGFE